MNEWERHPVSVLGNLINTPLFVLQCQTEEPWLDNAEKIPGERGSKFPRKEAQLHSCSSWPLLIGSKNLLKFSLYPEPLLKTCAIPNPHSPSQYSYVEILSSSGWYGPFSRWWDVEAEPTWIGLASLGPPLPSEKNKMAVYKPESRPSQTHWIWGYLYLGLPSLLNGKK